MKVFGLVGGVSSGKSLVAACFRELGAMVLDGDKAGHEVLTEPAVIEQLRQRWGDGILSVDGSVSRRTVAKIVFAKGGAEELSFLEGISHPRIEAKFRTGVDAARQAGNLRAVVLDAALLFDGGWDKLCDVVIFVSVPREIRLKRALARGWTEGDLIAREAVQLPLDEKRHRSGYVIDNSGTPDETRVQVAEFWRQYVGPTDH
ncbi:MAG TPA: dephospho-CoA kinase [Pirellulaceae bacterium]|nr:dephospho-CoA kinase [Pirellulaceae bacterium]